MDWSHVLERPPEVILLTIDVSGPEPGHDLEAWALEQVIEGTSRGGWVQLTDRVLCYKSGAWEDLQGRPVRPPAGAVESAEGVDSEGHGWRLRWVLGAPVLTRLIEGEGEPALCFRRAYLSSRGDRLHPEHLRISEYWTMQPRVALNGEAWTPHTATFSGWGK